MTDDLDRPYEPREVEERWYAFWEKEGVFDAVDSPSDTRLPYVCPMPPPNRGAAAWSRRRLPGIPGCRTEHLIFFYIVHTYWNTEHGSKSD